MGLSSFSSLFNCGSGCCGVPCYAPAIPIAIGIAALHIRQPGSRKAEGGSVVYFTLSGFKVQIYILFTCLKNGGVLYCCRWIKTLPTTSKQKKTTPIKVKDKTATEKIQLILQLYEEYKLAVYRILVGLATKQTLKQMLSNALSL